MEPQLSAYNVDSQTVGRINSRSKRQHESLVSQVVENQAALGRVQQEMEHMSNGIRSTNATSNEKLDDLSAQVQATQASVMSLRSFGEQITTYIGQFPREIGELLRAILRSNWQMYRVLLQIQQSTLRSPTGLLDSNIRFEDALGEHKELPYEYFRHWEVPSPASYPVC